MGRIRKEQDKIFIKFGDKEIKTTQRAFIRIIMLIIVLVIVLITGGIILYSDFHCGPIDHRAHDVPKPMLKR